MGYGYGFSGFLVVVGLILALAVDYQVQGLDLQVVGWIMAVVGVVLFGVTLFTNNSNNRSVQHTTYRDGSQSTTERRDQR